jgi:hypothetical protein
MNERVMAYKEAGHAVAAHMLGVKAEVSLHPQDSFGRRLIESSSRWKNWNRTPDALLRSQRQNEALVYLAGVEAIGEDFEVDESLRSDDLDWVRVSAKRMARRYDFGPMVDALAEALQIHENLSAEEVATIVATVRRRLDRIQMTEVFGTAHTN